MKVYLETKANQPKDAADGLSAKPTAKLVGKKRPASKAPAPKKKIKAKAAPVKKTAPAKKTAPVKKKVVAKAIEVILPVQATLIKVTAEDVKK